MTEDFGLDVLAKYRDAVKLFGIYSERARATEKELDAMLKEPHRHTLGEINKTVSEYEELAAQIAKLDNAMDNLYSASSMALDSAFKATAEQRLPRLMLSYIGSKKAEITDYYYRND